MVLSTLPDLAGQRYKVMGVVFSAVTLLRPARDDSLRRTFKALEEQAASMGADAIIDVKITDPSGEHAVAAVLGTAVKIIP